MLDIFRGLKNLVKVSHVKTDSIVFRLHYSITVMVLMSFSLIITTRQYVGNPIDCVHTKDIPEDVLNTYCWIQSTYTLRSLFLKKQGISVPYPGIGNSDGDPSDKKHYKYYQWVCFCLFFQVSLWERHAKMNWNFPHTAINHQHNLLKNYFFKKILLVIIIDYQKASLNSNEGSRFFSS